MVWDSFQTAIDQIETDPIGSEIVFRRILKKSGMSIHDDLHEKIYKYNNLHSVIMKISKAAREANKILEEQYQSQTNDVDYPVDLTVTKSAVNNHFIVDQHNLITKSLSRNEITKPSEFWKAHLENHVRMLIETGLDNFKRTLGHNYINFLNGTPASVHFGSHLDLWKIHGSTDVFNYSSEKPGEIGLKADKQHFNAVKINDESTWNVYTFQMSLMWEYAILVDQLKVLPKLFEPLYGNPLKIRKNSRIISQDLTHSVAEYSLIKEKTGISDKINVLEIGGGYGRLAHLFKFLGAKKYVMVDISPALIVAQNYMHKIMPKLKYFDFRMIDDFQSVEREFEEADVCFLSADQIGMLPDKYFDLAINVCSLMEMKLETIDYYLKQIDRTTTGYFYTKQWRVQNNKVDKIRLEKDDYPIPRHWSVMADRTDPSFTRLFEQVWKIG